MGARDPERADADADASRVRQILQQGGVAAIPTESFFALATNPAAANSIRRIQALKGRDSHKPIALLAASLAAVEAAFLLNSDERRLAETIWPGPYTLLLQPQQEFPPGIQGPDGRVGVRVSAYSRCRNLAQASGLLTATSANLAGQAPVRRADDLHPQIVGGVDAVLPAPCGGDNHPSALLRLLDAGRLECLRGDLKLLRPQIEKLGLSLTQPTGVC